MRMGVIEEVGGGDGGQSKIRSWRRVIVMRGKGRGVTGKSALAVEIAILFPELTLISI